MTSKMHLQEELDRLMANEEQRQAYICDDHCVVQAGPGSGKTATLTLKIMRLLAQDIPPPRGLACVTFNNEAVREFKNRLRELGFPSRSNVFLGTVHSFCLSCVIRPFGKLFQSDLPSPLRVAPDDLRGVCLQKSMDTVGVHEPPWEFQTRFNRYRRTHLDRTSNGRHEDEECAAVIEHYESLIREQGYLDFDDLVLIALELIETQAMVRNCLQARYPWLVIDEYQDLGLPLHRIVLTLVEKTDIRIFAVGDPDQSIYGFTGANPKYLQDLAARSDTTSVGLKLNYRCGQKIISGAEVILSREVPRNYTSSRGNSDPGEIDFIERSGGLEEQAKTIVEDILPQLEDAGYEPKKTAILYIDRNDAQVIVRALDASGIKYAGEKDQRYPRTPVTRWTEEIAQWCSGLRGRKGIRFRDLFSFWVKLLAETGTTVRDQDFLTQMKNFFDVLSDIDSCSMNLREWLLELESQLALRERLLSWRQWPKEKESFEEMLSACEEDGPLGGFSVADLAGIGPNANRLRLTTLHSSKGLQFDVVIIPGLEEGRLPSFRAQSEEAIAESRRTFYVGFTRARHLVFLLYSGWYQNQWGRTFAQGPSQFVLELQEVIGSEN